MKPIILVRIAEIISNNVDPNIEIEKITETWKGDYLIITHKRKCYLIDSSLHSIKFVTKETFSE
jgi:hypothetical protein